MNRTNISTAAIGVLAGVLLGGSALALMKRKADDVVRLVSRVPGAADVKAEQVIGLPTLRVRVDRDAIARYGINAEDVLDVIETVGGSRVGTVIEGQKRFALQARFSPEIRADLDSLRNLKIAGSTPADGRPRLIPLNEAASSLQRAPRNRTAIFSHGAEDSRVQLERAQRSRSLDLQRETEHNPCLPPGLC